MKLNILNIILIILLIGDIKAQNLFDPITKSTENFTQINSDFGPRNVSNGSTFHKGIDYQLSAFNPAYAIKSGNITNIYYRIENPNISYIRIGNDWRYMHMPKTTFNNY